MLYIIYADVNRVAVRPQHPHQALRGAMGDFCKLAKTDSRIDVIAQHGLARLHVPGKETLNSFAEEFSAEDGIALGAGLNRQFKVSRQGHEVIMVTLTIPFQRRSEST